MINLLPKKEKKRLYREYLIRLVTLYIFFIIIISTVALLLLSPSYYLVHLKGNILEEQAKAYEKDSTDEAQSSTKIALVDIQEKLLILSDGGDDVMLHEIISTIINGAGNGVSVTNVAYRNSGQEDVMSNITIKGVADRRESLRAFSQYIEDYEKVSSVDLPVSSLAKERDIDFEINIKGLF